MKSLNSADTLATWTPQDEDKTLGPLHLRRLAALGGSRYLGVELFGFWNVVAAEGKLDFHSETGIRVNGTDRPLVQSDGAAGDRESKPSAATLSIPVALHAIEGIKDAREDFFGHSGAMIPYRDNSLIVLAAETDFDRGVLGGVTDGITYQVFHGAAQELGIALHGCGCGRIKPKLAVSSRRFDRTISGNFPKQFAQLNPEPPLAFPRPPRPV